MSNDTETVAGDRDPEETRKMVRERYGTIATDGQDCCGDAGSDVADDGGCCDGTEDATGSERLGYDTDDIASIADGADLGLGCGNPTAFAEMAPGETVLDLGSGAGFDCFLAAQEVCPDGRVIGVDMTPEMVSKARENVAKNDADNVEFRLGEISHLPVADETVDVVISNCVVNLAPKNSSCSKTPIVSSGPVGASPSRTSSKPRRSPTTSGWTRTRSLAASPVRRP
ncbi:methyltransferase domain-containing protein [Haloarculaceae archaeon H-GB2-1]|nr:methyltransferase domain-containing protein [Haloarculaceae archaeon H-GB2-1]